MRGGARRPASRQSLRRLSCRTGELLRDVRRAKVLAHERALGTCVAHRARAQVHEQRLGGSLEDAKQPRIAEQLGHRIALDIATSAEQLHRAVHGLPEQLGRRGLADDERIVRKRDAGVERLGHQREIGVERRSGRRHAAKSGPRCRMVQQPARGHLPTRCEAMRYLHRALDGTEAHRRHAETRVEEGVVRDTDATADPAKHGIAPNECAVEVDGVLEHPAHAEGEGRIANVESARARGDNECGDAAVVAWYAREHVEHTGHARRADPALHAVQPPAIVGRNGERLDGPGIRTGSRFGERERGDPLAAGKRRHDGVAHGWHRVLQQRANAE